MRKALIFMLLIPALYLLPVSIGAQERFSLGLGFEAAQHTDDGGFNFGGALLGAYRFAGSGFPAWMTKEGLSPFDAGLKLFVAHNLDEMFTFEAGALFRWYFFYRDSAMGQWELFLQGDIGADFLYLTSGDQQFKVNGKDSRFAFMGGGTLGVRLTLPIDSTVKVYIEPYGRFAYPAGFGMGLMGGIKFKE
jgi:hypothetical protein